MSKGSTPTGSQRPSVRLSALTTQRTKGNPGLSPLLVEGSEPPRVCRRLHSLGGWSDGGTKQVLGRGAGAGGPDGARAAGPVRLAVGGDLLDRREARLLG